MGYYPKPGAGRQNINNNFAYTGGQSSVAGSTFGPQTFFGPRKNSRQRLHPGGRRQQHYRDH